jgi:apolipoprotein N-acyltransferase
MARVLRLRAARRRDRVARHRAAAVGLCLGYAAVRDEPEAEGPPQVVAVVQANLDLGAQWTKELYGKNLVEHLVLTRDALTPIRPALVVWPENVMAFFVEEEPLLRQDISIVLRPADLELVAGGVRLEERPTARATTTTRSCSARPARWSRTTTSSTSCRSPSTSRSAPSPS